MSSTPRLLPIAALVIANVIVSLPAASWAGWGILGLVALLLAGASMLSGNLLPAVVCAICGVYLLQNGSGADASAADRYAALRSAVSDQLGVQFVGDQDSAIAAVIGLSNTQAHFDNGHVTLLIDGKAADCLLSVSDHDGADYRLLVVCSDTPLPRVDGQTLAGKDDAGKDDAGKDDAGKDDAGKDDAPPVNPILGF
jgi:hypothetical protein